MNMVRPTILAGECGAMGLVRAKNGSVGFDTRLSKWAVLEVVSNANSGLPRQVFAEHVRPAIRIDRLPLLNNDWSGKVKNHRR